VTNDPNAISHAADDGELWNVLLCHLGEGSSFHEGIGVLRAEPLMFFSAWLRCSSAPCQLDITEADVAILGHSQRNWE
jgi:hypothetical protein